MKLQIEPKIDKETQINTKSFRIIPPAVAKRFMNYSSYEKWYRKLVHLIISIHLQKAVVQHDVHETRILTSPTPAHWCTDITHSTYSAHTSLWWSWTKIKVTVLIQ